MPGIQVKHEATDAPVVTCDGTPVTPLIRSKTTNDYRKKKVNVYYLFIFETGMDSSINLEIYFVRSNNRL
jgi:hypothetical protein